MVLFWLAGGRGAAVGEARGVGVALKRIARVQAGNAVASCGGATWFYTGPSA